MTKQGAAYVLETHQFGRFDAECLRQFTDIDDSDISLSSLDAAEIASGQAAFEREFLLRPTLLASHLGQALPKQHTRVC